LLTPAFVHDEIGNYEALIAGNLLVGHH
jgi:hypothetical protein